MTSEFKWLEVTIAENNDHQKVLRLQLQAEVLMESLVGELLFAAGLVNENTKQGVPQPTRQAFKSPAPPPPASQPPTTSAPLSRMAQPPLAPQAATTVAPPQVAKTPAPPPATASTASTAFPPTNSAAAPSNLAKSKAVAPAPAQPKDRPQERVNDDKAAADRIDTNTPSNEKQSGWAKTGPEAVGLHIVDIEALKRITAVPVPCARFGRGGCAKPSETPVVSQGVVGPPPGLDLPTTPSAPTDSVKFDGTPPTILSPVVEAECAKTIEPNPETKAESMAETEHVASDIASADPQANSVEDEETQNMTECKQQ